MLSSDSETPTRIDWFWVVSLQLQIGRSDNSVQQNEEDTVDRIYDDFPDDCCVGNVEECSHDTTDEPNDAREDYEE